MVAVPLFTMSYFLFAMASPRLLLTIWLVAVAGGCPLKGCRAWNNKSTRWQTEKQKRREKVTIAFRCAPSHETRWSHRFWHQMMQTRSTPWQSSSGWSRIQVSRVLRDLHHFWCCALTWRIMWSQGWWGKGRRLKFLINWKERAGSLIGISNISESLMLGMILWSGIGRLKQNQIWWLTHYFEGNYKQHKYKW